MSATLKNAFNDLKNTHPHAWPQSLVEDIGIVFPLPEVERECGTITENTQANQFGNLTYLFDKLRDAHQGEDIPGALDFIPRVLKSLASCAGVDKKISVTHTDHLRLTVAGEEYYPASISACTIDGITIFRYTDARYRHACRIREGSTNLGLGDWPEQDDKAINAFDVAVLLGLAQLQEEEGVPTNEGNYTVHLLYPNAACKKIIVLTAHIPNETTIAVANGLPDIKSIKLTRGEFEVSFMDDLKTNPTLKVIAGFLDEGAGLAEKTPY